MGLGKRQFWSGQGATSVAAMAAKFKLCSWINPNPELNSTAQLHTDLCQGFCWHFLASLAAFSVSILIVFVKSLVVVVDFNCRISTDILKFMVVVRHFESTHQ